MIKILKFLLLSVFILIFTISSASADLTDGNRAYWSFDNASLSGGLPTDLTGNGFHGQDGSFTSGQVGFIGDSFSFDGNTDYVNLTNQVITGTGDWSIQAVIQPTEATLGGYREIASFDSGGADDQILMLSNDAGDVLRCGHRGSSKSVYYTITYANWKNTFTHVVCTYNGGTKTSASSYDLYVNGSLYTTGKTTSTVGGANLYNVLGANANTAVNEFIGEIDEVSVWNRTLNSSEVSELWNGGNGSQYPYAAIESTNATERLQQNSKIYQNTSVTVNSLTYVPITSASITLSADALTYVTAPVVIEPTASNSAECRITIDGAEFGSSEKSRSLTAGETAVMLLNSYSENLSAGNHVIGLECKRTGGGKFDVTQSVLNANIMKSKGGDALQYNNYTISGSTGGVSYSNNFNTSENSTEAGLERSIVLEMSMQVSYTATGNLTFTPEIAGQNCTAITRYGTSGSTGSTAAVCAVSGVNNDTQYDFKIHTSGVNTTLSGVANIKEFINHPKEVNSTSLNGISITGNNQSLATLDITIAAGHVNPNIITEAIIDVLSTNGTQTPIFYIEHEGETSINVSRTVSEGQAGTLGVEQLFQSASGTETSTLYGSCFGCELQGGDMIAFVSNDVAATPNEFTVTAQNIYDNSTAINTFNITLSDGRSFATTTGTINVPSTGQIYNITLAEDADSDLPHYSTTVNNHNGTFDLVINATPYTVINATFGGAVVNNFTANGTTTSNGVVYLRLFNDTFDISLTDAVADDGTNLSDTSANITANVYLQNYTFILLTANAFTFNIYDEITEALITENMTLELINDNEAVSYTTTNGTLYLELLTPLNYTIRYKSTAGSNYTERDYYQILTDRQRYDIDLYGLENTEATDFDITIEDTGGDRVQGAIVKLLRYYVSCNCYNVVEMATTDANGEAYLIADAYDGHYKLAVDYQGVNYFLSTDPSNFIPSGGVITRTLIINLGDAYFQSFRASTDFATALTYNEATATLAYTWSDPSGLVTRGCLYAEFLDGVHYTPMTPNCANGDTGSVLLTINNSIYTYNYYAELETSTTYSHYVTHSGIISLLKEQFLTDVAFGAFMGGLFSVLIALIFSFSAIAAMLSVGLSLVVLSLLGVFSFVTATSSMTFVIGFIAVTLVLATIGMRK